MEDYYDEEMSGIRPFSPEFFAHLLDEFQGIDDDFSALLNTLGRRIKDQIRRGEPFGKRDRTQKTINHLILMQSLMEKNRIKFINRYS
jgi:hypothetical protein